MSIFCLFFFTFPMEILCCTCQVKTTPICPRILKFPKVELISLASELGSKFNFVPYLPSGGNVFSFFSEIVWKLVGRNSMAIAERHAAMLRTAEFPSTFSLSLSLSLSLFPHSFSYPFLSLLSAVRLCLSQWPSDSFSLSLFLSYLPTTPTLFPLYSSIPSRGSTPLARTQCRSRECTLNFGGPGTYISAAPCWCRCRGVGFINYPLGGVLTNGGRLESLRRSL